MAIDFGDNNTEHGIPMGAYVPSSGGGGGQIEWVTFPNAVMIGEPVINGSQISGFTNTDYMMFPFILDVHDRPFEVNFSFTTGDDVTTQQNILDSQFGLALAISGGKGLMAVSNNGTSWAGQSVGNINILPNTTYYAKLTWNRLQYKTALSVDGKTFIDDMAITNATRPYPRTMYIGGGSVEELGHTTHPFQGIIDMKNASLLVDGNTVWLGMDDPGLATRADISLSNLDAAGEARFTAKQDKLIAMDGVMIVGNEISANVDGETVIINGSGQLEAVGGGGTGDLRGVAPIAVEDKIESPLHFMEIADAATNAVYSPTTTSAYTCGENTDCGTRGTGLRSYGKMYTGLTGDGIDLDECLPNGYILTEYKHGQIIRLRNASTRLPVMFFGKFGADGKFIPVTADPCPDATKYISGGISSAAGPVLQFQYAETPGMYEMYLAGQTLSGGERVAQANLSSSGRAGIAAMGNYWGYGNIGKAASTSDATYRALIDSITHVVIIPSVFYHSGSSSHEENIGTAASPLRVDIYENNLDLEDAVLMGTNVTPALDTMQSIFSVDSTEYTQVSFEGEFVAVPVIIDSHVDGTSGFRVWSKDKTGYNYCEQWGRYSGGNQNITLLKTYKDTSYSCFVQTSKRNNMNWNGNPITCVPQTNNTIACSTYGDYTDIQDAMWEASGYLAEGQYDA